MKNSILINTMFIKLNINDINDKYLIYKMQISY